MAFTPSILYQGQPGTTDTVLYTVPANKRADITAIICGNTDASTRWITLNIVKAAGTVTNLNMLGGKQKKLEGTGSVNGGGEWAYEIPTPLSVGDQIHGIQELSSAIAVTIIGLEEDV